MTDLVPLLTHPTTIVGATGAGKTFTAKGAVEALLALGRRVVIIDPTGAWWGLRSGAYGDSAGGFAVTIFGGDHADIPIAPEHGATIAEAIAQREVQAIIDTSEMTGGEKIRFLTDFLTTLYARNKAALHLVVDEADEVCPQNPMPDERRLSGAFDKIVRRGRSKGFRPLMITQRPAVLHKNVLSQIGTLIALKLTSPQDRKAIEEWVKGNADADVAKSVVGSLSSLARGEGWVWSPAGSVLDRQTFPAITTFDSSRTPTEGEAAVEPALSAVDVAALREAMTASEPTEPGKKINKASAEALALATELAFQDGYAAGVEEGRKSEAHRLGQRVLDFAAEFALMVEKRPDNGILFDWPEKREVLPSGPSPENEIPAGFSAPQERILRSLAIWKGLGHATPTKVMVAAAAGYRHGSGNYTNLLSQLRTAGAIDYPEPGRARLLASGFSMSIEEARDMLLGIMTAPQRKLFDALTHGEMSKVELGEATGYSHTSGNFTNLLSQLRSLGLVEYPAPGRAGLASWVFDIL